MTEEEEQAESVVKGLTERMARFDCLNCSSQIVVSAVVTGIHCSECHAYHWRQFSSIAGYVIDSLGRTWI